MNLCAPQVTEQSVPRTLVESALPLDALAKKSEGETPIAPPSEAMVGENKKTGLMFTASLQRVDT
jgi:hypothetical protein